jgi:cytochrome b subunit of formate dehydrogenase
VAIAADRAQDLTPLAERVPRHAGIDRLFHWLTAFAVLILMATGILPHVGVHFDWVAIHWVTGLALTVLVVFHIVRSLFWQHLAAIWFTVGEFRARRAVKYSIAQRLMHHAMGLMVLAAVVTGLLMLKKIRTPFFLRDPYFLGAGSWGVVYFIHGLAALAAVTLVMIHIYFALIPENRRYLRAMIRGWMTREEQREHAAGSLPAGKKPT